MVRARTKFDQQSHNFSELTEILFPSAASSQDSEAMILSTSTTSKCVEIQMEGVPIRGIIDTRSDITILSGSAFQEIATINNLKKEQFKPADRKACTYGHHPLNLDGQIDLHIKFGEKCICETVYVKLDAPDTLLLSENACCKLQIVSYHPDVQPVLDHEPGQWKSKRPS